MIILSFLDGGVSPHFDVPWGAYKVLEWFLGGH